ncbi:hypothetical protein EPO15_15625, partial [bacterium]
MKALLSLLLALPASAGKPGRAVVHPEAHFTMTAPGAWSQTLLGPDDLGPGAAGAVFKSSPSARGEEEPSLTVIFYSAGNPHFKNAADYLARQTEPLPVTPEGEETGPVTAAKLGALAAKTLTRSRPVGRPEEAVRRGVKLTARLTVAEAPGGFFVVTCTAPAPRWASVRPLFDAALKSFMP